MLDTYSPEPFDGAERFKRFCSTVDEVPADIPKPRYDIEHTTLVPRSGLFDIYKRTTNKPQEIKCVGVGFTYAEATEFIDKRLKPKVDYRDSFVVFYEVVPQDNKDARHPLWNPKEFTKEDVVIESNKC